MVGPVTATATEANLEPRLVGDIAGDFYVPAYQRGYRWGEHEVVRLLDDIWESRERPYYLQPVVVKRYGDEWELVDGQQRLTTLFLIFQYMQREGLQNSGAGYSMRYETRPGSAAYLESLDPASSQQNIDFFHIHEAYQCISRWFEEKGAKRQWYANKFYDALFEQVRVIWYEAPEDLDATTLFTRLNVGRIPLTDAELVKALLLSRGQVGATNRSMEIAAQWDTIERELRDPELWAFITGRSSEDPTHISLLLDSIAGGPAGRERAPFHTFDTLKPQIAADPYGFWEEVVARHSLILGWHQNRDLFHKIGFLVSQKTTLTELLKLSNAKRKSVFEAELDGLIRDQLNLSESDLRGLEYRAKKTEAALLLMNVETVRQRRHSSERYSFREHSAGGWTQEHIHAQNAELLNRAEQWEAWLVLHRKAVVAFDGPSAEEKQAVLDRIDGVLGRRTLSEEQFRTVEREVVSLLSGGEASSQDDMNSIANLALLHGRDNSALGNSVFLVKRDQILDRDRSGSFIPVCTRNVFLKYYSPADQQQVQFWSPADRTAYLEAMVETIRPYLRRHQETSA